MERSDIEIVLKMPAGTKAEYTKDWLEKIVEAAKESNEYFSNQRTDSLRVIENFQLIFIQTIATRKEINNVTIPTK